jgi:hypothetical protein
MLTIICFFLSVDSIPSRFLYISAGEINGFDFISSAMNEMK